MNSVGGFCGYYGHIAIQKDFIHTTADGRRILVIHGHELDTVVQNARWLAFAGDLGYQFLLSLNPLINFVRRRFGLGYWSLSAYAKKRVKDAVNFIGEFENAIVRYAAAIRGRGGALRPHSQRRRPANRRGHLLQLRRLGRELVRRWWRISTARSSCSNFNPFQAAPPAAHGRTENWRKPHYDHDQIQTTRAIENRRTPLR